MYMYYKSKQISFWYIRSEIKNLKKIFVCSYIFTERMTQILYILFIFHFQVDGRYILGPEGRSYLYRILDYASLWFDTNLLEIFGHSFTMENSPVYNKVFQRWSTPKLDIIKELILSLSIIVKTLIPRLPSFRSRGV